MRTSQQEQREKELYDKKLAKIDSDLDCLNKFLLEIKKKRKFSERMENQLSKRKKLLNKEEIKVGKQLKLVEKNKEFKEQIKVNLLKNKEILEKKKAEDERHLAKQKTKNNIMKNEIQNSLKNWKNNLKIKNKEGADKAKEERKIIDSITKSGKKDAIDKNRLKHDMIIYDHLQNEEKRKIEEKNKKMKIRCQLEDKIKREINLKKKYDDKINRTNKENDLILKRIKDYNPEFQISSHKKRRTSCTTPKMSQFSLKKY